MRKLSSQNKLLSMKSDLSSPLDSSSWVIHIRSFFEEKELENDQNDEDDARICIYNVPKSLRAYKPEAYSPQIIALGPYHHQRQDLYEMERYKLICAKKVQIEFKSNVKIEDLVKKLMKKEFDIRACFHKYLDMNGEALAWMMAIDGLFLIEFLTIYANNNNSCIDDLIPGSSRKSCLVTSMGKKMGYDALLKDVLMVENQIPIFVLKKILRVQFDSLDLVDNLLHRLMMGVCREVAPLVLNDFYPVSKSVHCAHLLDLLYHLIVPIIEQDGDETTQDMLDSKDAEEESSSLGENKEVLSDTWKIASKLKFMKKFTKLLDLKPVRLIAKLPIKVISKLPIVSAIAPMLESMFFKDDNKEEKASLSKDDTQVPLVEEIMVPSVQELTKSGIEFCPTIGDISTISFDRMARKFYLPVINLDGNTEVIMRNLVAYEASSVSSPLVLARYTELMNGIIDTPKDVEILRRRNIIISRLRTDREVAELWNGMSKAIRLTKVSFIDEAIKEANGYFHNTLKRKCSRIMKAYVYGSWRMLVILATILLLALMTLQSFCAVYSCPRFFNIDETPPPPPPQG